MKKGIQFELSFSGDYDEDLFTIPSTQTFDDLNKKTATLVLESGFKIFQFLNRYQDDSIEIKDQHTDQENI